jgi:hemerythrin-like domain-containing protein
VNPFDQLLRSHRRLEERLTELREAVSPQRLDIVDDVLAFIERAVRRHEDDEEQSLFPRLAADGELAPTLAALAEEHRAHQALHARLREAARTGEGLAPVVDALVEAYRAHIHVEETSLFPAARRLLDAAALDAIAGEMQARRGR